MGAKSGFKQPLLRNAMDGLTQEDSSLIGFVVACYFCDAIGTADLNRWAEHILATRDHYPDYILDLLEFNEARFHIYRVIGFSPSAAISRQEDEAIAGIAYLRGSKPMDGPPVEVALNRLKKMPAVRERFLSTFPFLDVPAGRFPGAV